jgi:hypothetical protein
VAAEQDTQSIGVVSQLTGEAWLIDEGESTPLILGMEIPFGAEINCAGNLTIKLNDGSYLSIAADTTIEIMRGGELMVKNGSAEFTNKSGQLVRLKEGDKVIVAMGGEMEAETPATTPEAKYDPYAPVDTGEVAPPEVYEPASPAT